MRNREEKLKKEREIEKRKKMFINGNIYGVTISSTYNELLSAVLTIRALSRTLYNGSGHENGEIKTEKL